MKTLFPILFLFACGPKGDPTSQTCAEQLQCLATDGVSPCTDCEPICQTDYLPTEDQRHLEGHIDYAFTPPAGGAHNACWYDWGIFDHPVPEERFLHNQEHGGVIFLYNCPDGCEDELATLSEYVEGIDLAILAPYPKMRWRFAVSAWEYRTMMNCLDMNMIEEFYDMHRDNGPEAVSSMPPENCM